MMILWLFIIFVMSAITFVVQFNSAVDIQKEQQKHFDAFFSENNISKQKVWVEQEAPTEEDAASSNTETNASPPKSEIESESSETSDDGFIPITVADDEYIEPPIAKSSIQYEDEPDDDDDIIKDKGESSYYSELAKQQARMEEV